MHEHLSFVKHCLFNHFYLYEKSCKKLKELCLLHKTLENIYEFQNEQVKPAKFHSTQWIGHVVQSMTGFVQVWSLHPTHKKYVISNTSKHCDMVEAEVLVKYSIFIDILDSAKNFSLASEYKDIDIILLVERIDEMNLSYQLFANKFHASPESVFELPHMKKSKLKF